MDNFKIKNREEDGEVIDLLHIFSVLWHKAWLILLCGILVGALFFSWATFMIDPMYSSTAMMYVNNSSLDIGSISISASELSAAQSLVNTYLVILQSRTTLTEVIENTGVDCTYEELRNMISASSVNGTEIFSITVTADDPYKAKTLAAEISAILPARVEEIIDGSSMRMVDAAVVNTSKVSPNITKYTAIGLFIGIIASCAVLIVVDLLDDVIRDENFILQTFDLPILARVPDMTNEEASDHYGHYSGY